LGRRPKLQIAAEQFLNLLLIRGMLVEKEAYRDIVRPSFERLSTSRLEVATMVRHTLGVPFAGETMNSDWILADVHMTGYPFPDTETSVYWHKDGAFAT
jgi:hypothetical protein